MIIGPHELKMLDLMNHQKVSPDSDFDSVDISPASRIPQIEVEESKENISTNQEITTSLAGNKDKEEPEESK